MTHPNTIAEFERQLKALWQEAMKLPIMQEITKKQTALEYLKAQDKKEERESEKEKR